MNKVLILVEGQTEETFVKRMLNAHLSPLNTFAVPVIIATKKVKSGRHFKGGVTSYQKFRKEIQRLLGDTSARMVTTMIDYYGLPDAFPGRSSVQGATSIDRVRFVEAALSSDIAHDRFLPYLSLHEFESLLFVSPLAIAQELARPELESLLTAIRNSFPTPEDINDDPATAPSARLASLHPGYSKPFFGLIIASRIGIQAMRDECKHFDEWLTRMESLSEAQK